MAAKLYNNRAACYLNLQEHWQALADCFRITALDPSYCKVTSPAHTVATWVILFFYFFWVTGELSTLRQLMKVPNEPGLSPNNGLENVSLSDQSMASNPRKGQAKCPGAKTTSHDGRAGHVMTHMCHRSKARRMASVTIQVPMQGICTPATRIALWPAKLPSQAMSYSRPRARRPVKTCSAPAATWFQALSASGRQLIQHAQTGQLHTVSPHLQLLQTPSEPVSNPSPVQVISWDPSRPWRGPAHQSAQLDDPLYLQGQLWGPHHLSLGVWGWGSQPAHQLVVKQAGQRLRLIRSFATKHPLREEKQASKAERTLPK